MSPEQELIASYVFLTVSSATVLEVTFSLFSLLLLLFLAILPKYVSFRPFFHFPISNWTTNYMTTLSISISIAILNSQKPDNIVQMTAQNVTKLDRWSCFKGPNWTTKDVNNWASGDTILEMIAWNNFSFLFLTIFNIKLYCSLNSCFFIMSLFYFCQYSSCFQSL